MSNRKARETGGIANGILKFANSNEIELFLSFIVKFFCVIASLLSGLC